MVVYHWHSFGGPAQSGFTSPFSADGWDGEFNIPEGHTLRRTFVETALYTRTYMTDTMATVFNPDWYADNGTFNLALVYEEGGGLPGSPLLPDEGEGGGGEFLWRAVMRPTQDAIWITAGIQSQIVRWEPQVQTQMQSRSRRGPVEVLGTYLYWAWKVTDVNGRFADDTVDLMSYMTGHLQAHVLTSTLS